MFNIQVQFFSHEIFEQKFLLIEFEKWSAILRVLGIPCSFRCFSLQPCNIYTSLFPSASRQWASAFRRSTCLFVSGCCCCYGCSQKLTETRSNLIKCSSVPILFYCLYSRLGTLSSAPHPHLYSAIRFSPPLLLILFWHFEYRSLYANGIYVFT